jgi:hypothetical protein
MPPGVREVSAAVLASRRRLHGPSTSAMLMPFDRSKGTRLPLIATGRA